MGRKLSTCIKTEDEFKLLLNALAVDLGRVNDYLTLFKKLVEAQKGTFWRGMSQSQAFWSTVLGALHDAALNGLARAYDQNDDALTIRTLLETIASEPTFLCRPEDFEVAQLNNDLDYAHHDTNTAVKHLMIWRHKLFAHRDPGKILNSSTLSEVYPITWNDIDALLENGFAIVNRYGATFFRVTMSHHVHGHDDYVRVLETLQAPADEFHRNLMEQIRQAESEAARIPSSVSASLEKPEHLEQTDRSPDDTAVQAGTTSKSKLSGL